MTVALTWNQSCTSMEAAMCGLTDIMEGGGGNGGPHSMNPYLNPKLRHNNNTMHPSPLLSTHLHPTTTIPDSRCCLCYQRVILLSVTIAHVSQCCWFNVETLHSPPVHGMLQPFLTNSSKLSLEDILCN